MSPLTLVNIRPLLPSNLFIRRWEYSDVTGGNRKCRTAHYPYLIPDQKGCAKRQAGDHFRFRHRSYKEFPNPPSNPSPDL